jgi:hypothetical protein
LDADENEGAKARAFDGTKAPGWAARHGAEAAEGGALPPPSCSDRMALLFSFAALAANCAIFLEPANSCVAL